MCINYYAFAQKRDQEIQPLFQLTSPDPGGMKWD